MKARLLFILSIAATCLAAPAQTADTTRVDLMDVVVTGTRNATDVRHLPMTVTVVGREQLTEQQRASIVPTLTEQVPGLFATSRGMVGYGVSGGNSGDLKLRGAGSAAAQLLVLIDGHPQYQGIYGHSVADNYLTLMAERVEVLRGPASMLYGSNAMGGVINIVTRAMREDGVKTHATLGAGSWGTLQAEASNQVRAGRFSSTVAAQYGRSDNHRPNMGFEQYGGYVKLGYDLSDHWLLYADADITHFNASQPGAEDALMLEADQWITRGIVSLAVENHYERTSGALSLYDNFGRHKINDGYRANGGTPQTDLFRSKDAVMGLNCYQTFSLFTGNRLTAGVDFQHIYGHAWYTDRKTGEEVTKGPRIQRKQVGEAHINEVATYADFRQDLTPWLTIDAGLRWDHHELAGTEWIPQGGLVVRPVRSGELKAMVSKGFRNPTMKEMYLYPSASDELRPERMMNYELSWRHRLPDCGFSYGANLFYLKADNLIETVKQRNINTGEVENWGVEAEATWRPNRHLSLCTNHSYLNMKNPVVAAPVYKGYLGANYRCGKWSATAGVMQVSGLYTETSPDEHQENFTLLNATLGYQLLPQLGLWVKGENLLAQDYEVNAGYPMPRATFMGGINVSF